MKQLDQIQQSREAYERIPIPDNLDERVREGVRQGRAARAARRRRTIRPRSAQGVFWTHTYRGQKRN